MLYLSEEMLRYHNSDDRYRRTLRLWAEENGADLVILEEKRPELENPHLFDTFYGDFEGCLHRLHERYPNHKLLANLSSGTPAMKSALAVLTQITDLKIQGIQVSSPHRAHNGERERLEDYDIEAAWVCNDDCYPERYEDRCIESKQENLRAKLLYETLCAHLKAYDYPAAVRVGEAMGALLPSEAMELLNAADLRYQVRWREIPAKLQESLISRGNGKERDIIEYILSLLLRQNRTDRVDFLRGLTPALFALSMYALKKVTEIDLEAYCDENGKFILNKIPMNVLDRLDRLYGGRFDSRYPNSDMCVKLLEDIAPTHPCVAPLTVLREIEIRVRNTAAHTLQPISEDLIAQECAKIQPAPEKGWNSEKIAEQLRKCTELIFERDCNSMRWNSYKLMNDKIKRASNYRIR